MNNVELTPAQFKRSQLTWEPPDYTSSYPAGFTEQGVAVIAISMDQVRAAGSCHVGLTALTYISRENGERELISQEPLADSASHCLMTSCDSVHTDMLGRAILQAMEQIPAQYQQNLITVAADKHYLKQLFRKLPQFRSFLEYRSIDKVLNPYEAHSLGEIHVKLAGTPAADSMALAMDQATALAHQEYEAKTAVQPLDNLTPYKVFTDCSYRSTNNKRYLKGGRMGIGGVSEEGFFFHSHYDATNIMTGELSAMLAAFHIFYHGGRQLIINTDSLGALTFLLRLSHSRASYAQWVAEGVQNQEVLALMEKLTEAIRERRVIVKHVPGHTGHGLQESSDSVSKMHRHFPGQVVDKSHVSEFNQRCESIITALSGCEKALRLPCPAWLTIKPSAIHARNRLWK